MGNSGRKRRKTADAAPGVRRGAAAVGGGTKAQGKEVEGMRKELAAHAGPAAAAMVPTKDADVRRTHKQLMANQKVAESNSAGHAGPASPAGGGRGEVRAADNGRQGDEPLVAGDEAGQAGPSAAEGVDEERAGAAPRTHTAMSDGRTGSEGTSKRPPRSKRAPRKQPPVPGVRSQRSAPAPKPGVAAPARSGSRFPAPQGGAARSFRAHQAISLKSIHRRKQEKARANRAKRTKTAKPASNSQSASTSRPLEEPETGESDDEPEPVDRSGRSRAQKEAADRAEEMRVQLREIGPLIASVYPSVHNTPQWEQYPMTVKERILPGAVTQNLHEGRTVLQAVQANLEQLRRKAGVRNASIDDFEPSMMTAARAIDISIGEFGLDAVRDPANETLYRSVYSHMLLLDNADKEYARAFEAFPTRGQAMYAPDSARKAAAAMTKHAKSMRKG